VKERAKKLNPNIEIFAISAKTGAGMDAWIKWLKEKVESWSTGK
jgi:hydrogenase nickel incorporation protein HypB